MKNKKVLITGGTTFASRFIAEYYVKKNYEVYVLNRNSKKQSEGVILINADRHKLGDKLKGYHFDAVLDITAYNAPDINDLLDALGSFDDYVFISSSAVYPEYETLPFKETANVSQNRHWGKYGTDKIEAETTLLNRLPSAYIIRPPYLYGPMNNLYREAFIFDCALQNRKFYLPKNGDLKLQFFHIQDLCIFIDNLIEKKPNNHIFNVGNKELITVKKWVEMCYNVVGKNVEFINVYENTEQRNYFCFYNYEYYLDTDLQDTLLNQTKPLYEGLSESLQWYLSNQEKVNKKNYFDFIDNELA